MKAIRFILLVILGIFILYVKLKTPGTDSIATAAFPAAASPAETNGAIPQKAFTVLQYVRQNGQAPEGYVGGRVFENREGRLPAGGDYREFDVDPHNGQRNAERLIVEWSTKKAWYTGDHYQTFMPMP